MLGIGTRVFLGLGIIVMVLPLFALILFALPSDGTADRGRGCRGGERLRIQDLDVSHEPFVEGQRISAWHARIRLGGGRECATEVMVRDRDDIVGRAGNVVLRPGVNEIEIQPDELYRFQGREQCFDVIVDLEGAGRHVDSDRRFCAKQILPWSMRERGAERGDRQPSR
jgi:hypothetical protein